MGNKTVIRLEITDEEIEIVKKLSDGIFGQAIAKEKGENYNTFAFRLGQLKNKCGVKTTPHLVSFFLREKLIN